MRFVLLTAAGAALSPASAWACAACYGASDSPMAKGMNWGIFTLLGFIGLVLVGVATFAVYLARRGATARVQPTPAPVPQPAAAPCFQPTT